MYMGYTCKNILMHCTVAAKDFRNYRFTLPRVIFF